VSEATRRGFLAALAVSSPAAAELLKDVPEVKSAEILTVTPETVVVLRYHSMLSDRAKDHLKKSFDEALPGVRVVILEDGMDVKVLSVLPVEAIEPGKVVRLKTGGPPMTVTSVDMFLAAGRTSAEVMCCWFEGSSLFRDHFELDVLEVIPGFVTPPPFRG
jgi:uncharacterized protein YodC (DUF2158 family)